MKLTALSLALFISASAANIEAQQVSVSVTNAKVKTILNTLSDQTGLSLAYSSEVVDLNRKVSINLVDTDIDKVLTTLFRNTTTSYEIKNGKIYLFNINNTKGAGIAQQTHKIKGVITDESGEPIIGANVVVKGTTTGTITDVNGEFSIDVPLGTTLVISYIGYNDYTIKVDHQKKLNITLKEDNQSLDEVVVVGYGTMRKGNLTGAVSSIKADALVKAPIANVKNTLAGQLPGLVAKQTTGQPGADGAALNIRGFGGPLVIVDGIEASMDNLDPGQIENISILKDGAASIYGARAGNGVILVTTKRGTVQKPTITYNGSYTMQGNTKMAEPATAYHWALMQNEAYRNQEKPEAGIPWSDDDIEKFRQGTEFGFINYNWVDYCIRKWAPQWNQNVSVRGGSDKIKYMGYFGYTDQQTMFRNNGGNYKKYNVQSNVDADITDRLKISIDLMMNFEDRNFPVRGIGEGSALYNEIFMSRPWYPTELPDKTKFPYAGIDGGNAEVMSNMKKSGYSRNKNRNIRANAALTYDFKYAKGLQAKAFISFVNNNGFGKSFHLPGKLYTYTPSLDQYNHVADLIGAQASLSESMNQGQILTQQYSLHYQNVFKNDHRFSALALLEMIDSNNNHFNASRKGFLTPAIEELFGGTKESMDNNGGASEMGRASFVARVNYGYKNKYLIETIFRADASAKFPKSDRWGFFPSVSVGWVASQENFLKNVEVLDNLKLRASFGQSGNDGVSNFAYLAGYKMAGTYVFNGQQFVGIAPTGLANPNLTWEKISIYNGGVDFSLFNSKLYGTVEGFYRLRDGIPGQRLNSFPSTFGAPLPAENLNSMSNRGFDLNIGTKGNVGDFTYDVSGNISWSRAKWEEIDEPEYTDPDDIRIRKNAGRWTDRKYGYISDGLFTSQKEIDELDYVYHDLGNNKSLRPGDVKYVDVNKDGVLDWRDQQEIGKGAMPHWMYGINGNFKYKSFDLSLLFQGAFGYTTGIGTNYETEYKFDERWNPETNDPNALIPRLDGSNSNNWGSDYGQKNVSYIRLKNMSFGYNIPKNILQKIHVKNARFYIAGTNLFTISNLNKYRIDPESPNNTNKHYPQQRTISFGLNLSIN